MKQQKLLDLVSVGPAMARDFNLLGIYEVKDLLGCSAQELYQRLCDITGVRHDPCCLDVFAAAIAQAQDPHLPPEQKQWWYYSRLRKSAGANDKKQQG